MAENKDLIIGGIALTAIAGLGYWLIGSSKQHGSVRRANALGSYRRNPNGSSSDVIQIQQFEFTDAEFLSAKGSKSLVGEASALCTIQSIPKPNGQPNRLMARVVVTAVSGKPDISMKGIKSPLIDKEPYATEIIFDCSDRAAKSITVNGHKVFVQTPTQIIFGNVSKQEVVEVNAQNSITVNQITKDLRLQKVQDYQDMIADMEPNAQRNEFFKKQQAYIWNKKIPQALERVKACDNLIKEMPKSTR
jgi:hypothetical protein